MSSTYVVGKGVDNGSIIANERAMSRRREYVARRKRARDLSMAANGPDATPAVHGRQRKRVPKSCSADSASGTTSIAPAGACINRPRAATSASIPRTRLPGTRPRIPRPVADSAAGRIPAIHSRASVLITNSAGWVIAFRAGAPPRHFPPLRAAVHAGRGEAQHVATCQRRHGKPGSSGTVRAPYSRIESLAAEHEYRGTPPVRQHRSTLTTIHLTQRLHGLAARGE